MAQQQEFASQIPVARPAARSGFADWIGGWVGIGSLAATACLGLSIGIYSADTIDLTALGPGAQIVAEDWSADSLEVGLSFVFEEEI